VTMSSRAFKIWRALRDLPLTEAREVVYDLRYAEEWVFTNAGHQRCGHMDAVAGEIRCIGLRNEPAILLVKRAEVWEVLFKGDVIGSAKDCRAAQDIAETELELRGYILPWRRA